MTDLHAVEDIPDRVCDHDHRGVHRVGIVNDYLSSHGACLTLDGKPLLGVREITVRLAADCINVVTLTIDATFEVELAQALVKVA
jgi:hypothetical protein